MRSLEFRQTAPAHSRRQSQLVKMVIVAGWIGASVGAVGTATQSHAQSSYPQLLPPSREEIADQERLGWTLKKFPSQPYMSEIYWRRAQRYASFLSRIPAAVRRPHILSDARQF